MENSLHLYLIFRLYHSNHKAVDCSLRQNLILDAWNNLNRIDVPCHWNVLVCHFTRKYSIFSFEDFYIFQRLCEVVLENQKLTFTSMYQHSENNKYLIKKQKYFPSSKFSATESKRSTHLSQTAQISRTNNNNKIH